MSWLGPDASAFGSEDHGHLGDHAAALVDGTLGHVERDLALAHIAHCDVCRREVEAQRKVKARLLSLRSAAMDVPVGLTASLLAIGAPPQIPAPVEIIRVPAYRPHHRLRLAAATAVSVAASGAVVLAIGGGPGPGRPVQPPIATLMNQHAATIDEVPISDPGFVAVTASYSR